MTKKLRVITNGEQIIHFQTSGNVDKVKLAKKLSKFFSVPVNLHTCNGSTLLFANSLIAFECCGAQEIEKIEKNLKDVTGIEVHFGVNTDELLPIKTKIFALRDDMLHQIERIPKTIKRLSKQLAEEHDKLDKANLENALREIRNKLKRLQKEIIEIEVAICRIAKNEFGICTICGEKIKIDRLRSVPTTPFCEICGAGVERQNKRIMGI